MSGGHSLLSVTDPAPSTNPPMPVEITAAITGVGDTFREPATQNSPPYAFSTESEAEQFEIPNHFYIPRGGDNRATHRPSRRRLRCTTQTTNGLLPVTVLANYVGLGNGFSNWTLQNLLPPHTTLAVGKNQIVQWVNLRLTILN